MPTKQSAIQKRIIEGVGIKKEGQKSISYSQYSVYKECPYRWDLTYRQGLYPFTSNINSIFGTSFHETLQEYIRLLYTVSVKSSDEMDFSDYLSQRMTDNYLMELEKNNGIHFIKVKEAAEYHADGIAILEYLRKKRKVLFDYNTWELIAIELPLYVSMMENYDVLFNGYLDLIFYNEEDNIIKIPDIKTSTKTWTDYQKKNQLKMDQALLYKHYFGKHYGIDPEDIAVEYFIVKRKIYEDSEWPQPRHQIHIPAQASARVKLAVNGIEKFVKECFNPDGTYTQIEYPKTPSKSACRFCPFNNNPQICDQKPG